MKKKTWLWIAGLLVALMLVGAVGTAVVYAQSSTPPAPHWGKGRGPGGWHGPLSSAQLDAAAKALGMTSDDLSAALKNGKTLQQLATEKGVDLKVVMQAMQVVRPTMLGPTELEAAAKTLGMTTDDLSAALKSGKTFQELADTAGVQLQTVQDAIKAARTDQIRTQIEQAVKDGKLTQAKADWLLEGLDKGFLDGPGFGFGFGGPRGHNGFRGGPGPFTKPTQSSP
jgi:uncharacterized membrane protein